LHNYGKLSIYRQLYSPLNGRERKRNLKLNWNVTNAAFFWGREHELVFTGSKLLVFTSNWRRLIFLQLTTCDHEFSSSRECFGTVFVLVYMVNTSSRPQRNAA